MRISHHIICITLIRFHGRRKLSSCSRRRRGRGGATDPSRTRGCSAALLGRPDLAPTPWPGSKATSGGSTFPLFRVRGPPSSTARGGPLLVPALPLATRPSRGSCRGHATCACAPTRCAPVGNVTLPPPVPAPGFLAAASPALAVPSATHDPVVRRRRQSPSTCRASTHPVSSERRASASPFF